MKKIERKLLNTTLLQSFLTIAACGNLTLAAERLGRTQSAISVQLRRLEDDLGAQLFERQSTGMVLTDAGAQLLPRAQRIVRDLRSAGELFATPLTGHLRIGLPDDYDDTVLEQALAGFSRRHPAVSLDVRSGCTSHYPDEIATGALDLAVYSSPGNTLGRPLAQSRVCWAAATDMRLPPKSPVPLAILDRRCWWRDAPMQALSAAGMTYDIVFQSSSFSGLKAALRAGFAVGIVPEGCMRNGLTAPALALPSLPVTWRSVLIRPEAPGHLTAAMADALDAACRVAA